MYTMISLCFHKFIIYISDLSHMVIYTSYTLVLLHMYLIYTVPSLHAHIYLMDPGYSSYSLYFPYTWYFHHMLIWNSCTLDLHHMLVCMIYKYIYMTTLSHGYIYIHTHICHYEISYILSMHQTFTTCSHITHTL